MSPDLSKDNTKMLKLGVGITCVLRKYYEKKPQGGEHLDVSLEHGKRQQRNSIMQKPAHGQNGWAAITLFSVHQLNPQRNKITILIFTTYLIGKKQSQPMQILGIKYQEFTK